MNEQDATLVGLCRKLKSNLEGRRVYHVKSHGKSMYVAANSPGRAALSVCEVERVRDKELITAAFEALAKGDA